MVVAGSSPSSAFGRRTHERANRKRKRRRERKERRGKYRGIDDLGQHASGSISCGPAKKGEVQVVAPRRVA
jgi:hypothetical protein